MRITYVYKSASLRVSCVGMLCVSDGSRWGSYIHV